MNITKILLIIKIIWYLIKYDFEIIQKKEGSIYKKNRFVNIYKLDNNTILKQFHHYNDYSICSLVKDNFNLPLFSKNSFAYNYILYCVSLLPKWFTIENRSKYNYTLLPKIWDIDKVTLSYKEEYQRTIMRYDCYWTKERINKIIDDQLLEFNKQLNRDNLYFVFLERKNMGVNINGELKIIEGELWNDYQFRTIKKIVNKWCPAYKFNNYNGLDRIMV